MDAYSIDTTATSRPPFVQTAAGDGGATPVFGKQTLVVAQRTATEYALPFRAGAGTQLESERRAAIDSGVEPKPDSSVPVETAGESRGHLIALKFRGQSTAEDLGVWAAEGKSLTAADG